MAALVAPRLEVVADPDAVEAGRLGPHPELDELARTELLGRGLVADGEGRGHRAMVARRPRVSLGTLAGPQAAGGRPTRPARRSARIRISTRDTCAWVRPTASAISCWVCSR